MMLGKVIQYIESVAKEVERMGYDYQEALNAMECLTPDWDLKTDAYRVVAILEGEL